MNKQELISAVAEKTGLTKMQSEAALSTIVETISGTIASGGQVALIGFGTFKSVKRNARSGKNPRTGEKIKIAARVLPKFDPGKSLKERVNNTKKSSAKATTVKAAPAKTAKPAAKAAPAKVAAKPAAKAKKK